MLLDDIKDTLKWPVEEKDWERFKKYICPSNWLECWIWQGSKERRPGFMVYGRFWHRGKPISAHRFIAQCAYGELQSDVHVDHLACSNPPCVNPLHLLPVTPRQNVLRSDKALAAKNARKKKCYKGHAFTEENTYIFKGRRSCRKCRNEHKMRHQRKYPGRRSQQRTRSYAEMDPAKKLAINAARRAEYRERVNGSKS